METLFELFVSYVSIKSFIVSQTHWSKVAKRLNVITKDFVEM